MPTEGRVTGGLSPGEQIRTFEVSTTASDEGTPSTKNVQAVALTDPTTAGRSSVVGSDGALVIAQTTRATYAASTGPITGATATGTKTLAYLWHPSTVTALRYDLLAVNVSVIAGAGGAQRIELRRITAENATPGGTTGTAVLHDTSNAATGSTVRIAPTGAPTISTGTVGSADFPVGMSGRVSFPPTAAGWFLDYAQPYVMRASQAEGFVVTQEVTTTITTAPVFVVTFVWAEVAP